jgi:hypothetical protein
VQLKLAGVHAGEEVLSEERIQEGRRSDGEDEEDQHEDAGMADAEIQHAPIAAADALEAVLESLLKRDEWITGAPWVIAFGGVMLAQHVFRHGWDQGSREQVRRQHGEDDGFGQRYEEVLRNATEEEHRHEDDADGDGGDKGWDGDLRGAVEDRLLEGLAVFEVAADVLDGDGGVVDQDADGQGEAAEGHDVDGLAERAQNQQRREIITAVRQAAMMPS